MSYTPDQLVKIAVNFEQKAVNLFINAAKKKEKKKLDPKAKVRNRGNVCVPASSAKDKKDHFPINDADQARNALARAHQYDKAPPWYSGSLKSLQDLVARKVKAKYPKIDVGGSKKEKKSSFTMDLLSFAQKMEKYGQYPGAEYVPKFQQMLSEQPATPTNQTITMPETVIDARPIKQQVQSDPRVKQIQTALNKLRLTGQDGKPLMVDGVFGKNTKFALNSFKTEYNMPQATDAMAMYYILNPSQNPNAKRYAEGTPTNQNTQQFGGVPIAEEY